MLPILIKLAEAWGDPYTVRKAFMDVLSVMFHAAYAVFPSLALTQGTTGTTRKQ